MNVYAILNNDAKAWWYHKQLRQWGNNTEARKRERKSILDHVETLRHAVFATVGRGGWAIHYVSNYGSIDHLSTLNGYGGTDEPMIQACIALGIPVCNSLTISDDDIFQVIALPMAAHPDASNLDAPRPDGKYGSFAYVDFREVFKMYAALGATLYN